MGGWGVIFFKSAKIDARGCHVLENKQTPPVKYSVSPSAGVQKTEEFSLFYEKHALFM